MAKPRSSRPAFSAMKFSQPIVRFRAVIRNQLAHRAPLARLGRISPQARHRIPSNRAGRRRCDATASRGTCASRVRAAPSIAELALRQPESFACIPRRSASAFGKNILVGVCSTSVRLMGLSRTSLALCVARHITAFNFRQVFGPSFAKSRTRDRPAAARTRPSSTRAGGRPGSDARDGRDTA